METEPIIRVTLTCFQKKISNQFIWKSSQRKNFCWVKHICEHTQISILQWSEWHDWWDILLNILHHKAATVSFSQRTMLSMMGRDHKFRHFDLCCLGPLCSLCYNAVFKITLRKRLALFGLVPLFPLMTSLLHMSECLLEKCLLMLYSLNTVIHTVFEWTKYQTSTLGETGGKKPSSSTMSRMC